jgi:DNA-binding PadR family transcriptional regulator
VLIPVRTRTERTTDQATLTECAVLGLLTRGERSGYDLLKTIERSVGFFWTPAKSQLYALLPKLVERGLLNARRVEQDKRPAKTLYRITPAGRGPCVGA